MRTATARWGVGNRMKVAAAAAVAAREGDVVCRAGAEREEKVVGVAVMEATVAASRDSGAAFVRAVIVEGWLRLQAVPIVKMRMTCLWETAASRTH